MGGSGEYDTAHIMRSIPALVSLVLALALTVPAGPGHARGPAMTRAPVAEATAVQGMVPLDRVIPAVQRAVPGRVLDVQVVGGAYRVKVLTANGRVAHVLVDGRSGQVMRVE